MQSSSDITKEESVLTKVITGDRREKLAALLATYLENTSNQGPSSFYIRYFHGMCAGLPEMPLDRPFDSKPSTLLSERNSHIVDGYAQLKSLWENEAIPNPVAWDYNENTLITMQQTCIALQETQQLMSETSDFFTWMKSQPNGKALFSDAEINNIKELLAGGLIFQIASHHNKVMLALPNQDRNQIEQINTEGIYLQRVGLNLFSNDIYDDNLKQKLGSKKFPPHRALYYDICSGKTPTERNEFAKYFRTFLTVIQEQRDYKMLSNEHKIAALQHVIREMIKEAENNPNLNAISKAIEATFGKEIQSLASKIAKQNAANTASSSTSPTAKKYDTLVRARKGFASLVSQLQDNLMRATSPSPPQSPKSPRKTPTSTATPTPTGTATSTTATIAADTNPSTNITPSSPPTPRKAQMMIGASRIINTALPDTPPVVDATPAAEERKVESPRRRMIIGQARELTASSQAATPQAETSQAAAPTIEPYLMKTLQANLNLMSQFKDNMKVYPNFQPLLQAISENDITSVYQRAGNIILRRGQSANTDPRALWTKQLANLLIQYRNMEQEYVGGNMSQTKLKTGLILIAHNIHDLIKTLPEAVKKHEEIQTLKETQRLTKQTHITEPAPETHNTAKKA